MIDHINSSNNLKANSVLSFIFVVVVVVGTTHAIHIFVGCGTTEQTRF